MILNTDTHESVNATDVLARQRHAFLNEDVPTLKQRKARLAKLRAAVGAYREELEEAVSQDFGHRSRHETGILELMVIIQSINYLSRNLRRFMKPERRHVSLFYRAGSAHVEFQPLGVVGIMAPWNYPVSLTLIPLATALAAGNRAMLKPSELTPETSEVIRRMMVETFTAEEVSVVLGGPEVGAAFSRLPLDHLFFTGSTQVGRKVMNAASENLVPVTLELGGKSPVIIGRGHVNSRNMDNIVFGKLSNGGQTCVAPDYALVHEDDLESFVTEYSTSVSRFYPQGPTSQDYTSIVNDQHYQRLTGLIKEAREQGAKVIETGFEPETAVSRQRTLAPTLIVGASDDSAIMEEEIFGPVLPIRTYRHLDEVIQYVNDRPRPLALYYFGERDGDCDRVLQRTTSGNVGINNTIMHVAQEDLPFGGVGQSGMGTYHGIEGFRTMSHAKGVFSQGHWNLPSLVRAPFGRFAEFALALTIGVGKTKRGA
ncbi:coniferyl aldehyde dehydrogenase [Vreelandella populi]|uniref:Aldehyde dehydrogenase n=1 Tax=Vreelandella populi TaxID=2498858 RepID=A0A3S0YHY7_9GAMM|nr:coniferyl aldehyde dehydrogenase [Halomonas populi]RUR43603.1 coniferyl aldehyde dehydrogenase [Halomonas populi]